jgi:hypothetical protein
MKWNDWKRTMILESIVFSYDSLFSQQIFVRRCDVKLHIN